MNEQSYEYRTGQTEPAKSYRGIIAFLLILVIFLSGIVSALGAMNIRLFQMLAQMGAEDDTPLSFSQETDPTIEDSATALLVSGMSCVEPGEVYRELYHLPQGLYVAHVEENSPAQLAGIAPGDVLMKIAQTQIPDLTALESVMTQFSGNRVAFTVSRNGEELQFDLLLTGENP